MKNKIRVGVFVLLSLATWVGASAQAQEIALERLVRGLELPLAVVDADDGSGRLFVVEQRGRILILEDRTVRDDPFLDLSDQVSCCGERGLLGLAFHPDYERNGFFFVNYTDRAGNTVVSRFSVAGDPDRADAGSEQEVLTFAQPFANHNGGDLAFGPRDGYLYIATGDGGSGGDPRNNGQDLGTLLGKILRLDVDALPAAIPPDNPFVGDSGARDEIWAYGLRNPWRMSFERRKGALFIGDVGQNDLEEINYQPRQSAGGENYGWRLMEGSECFNPAAGCDDGNLTAPILEYDHREGCSVTGGYRYRGKRIGSLTGTYLYGDFCSGTIWGGTRERDGRWSSRTLLESGLTLSSFGEDAAGELYVVHYSEGAGAIYRVVERALFADGFESGDTSRWEGRSPGQMSVGRPGLAGTGHALRVSLDGASAPSFLSARLPRRQRRVAAEVLLNPNRVDLADVFVTFFSAEGSGASFDDTVFWVELDQFGRRYRVVLNARVGETALRFLGRTKVSKRRSTRLRIEWQEGSAPGVRDGILRLYKNGKLRIEATDVDNGGKWIDEIQVGLPTGAQEPGSGFFLLDEIVVTDG